MRRAMLFTLLLAACGPEPLPPFAEAVITVRTHLPVPQVASRLRIDLYAEDGRWFESRDIARPDPRDWPVSFSVYSEEEERAARVYVRLRVYSEGRVRDYLDAPRLVIDGTDVTPSFEPEPLVTVDRMVLVHLEPGQVSHVRVSMVAACAGTTATLQESCVATEKTGEPVREIGDVDEPLEPLPTGCSQAGTIDRACIPGGASILGSGELTLVPDLPPLPERLVVNRAFSVDRHEVTVARFRAALASGFVPSRMPVDNDAPLGMGVNDTCTWSSADLGREDYALSCVSSFTARELCQFFGGDLPSEAQWEHLATRASEHGRSRYPWGNDTPTCDRAVHGRLALGGAVGVCEYIGTGPLPEGAAPADVTPDGVVGAAGGLGEWVRDSYQDYQSECWAASPLVDPGCFEDVPAIRAMRGGSWAAPPTILASAARLGANADGEASFIGFRCAYPEAP